MEGDNPARTAAWVMPVVLVWESCWPPVGKRHPPSAYNPAVGPLGCQCSAGLDTYRARRGGSVLVIIVVSLLRCLAVPSSP